MTSWTISTSILLSLFIEEGIAMPNSYLSLYKNDNKFLEYIDIYYSKIKEAYHEAVKEGKSLVFIVG